MQRGEIYSNQLQSESGRRSYFFNLKVDRNDSPFMAIVESTPRPDGSYRRNQVLIYEEDVEAFSAEMEALLNHLKEFKANSGRTPANPRSDPHS